MALTEIINHGGEVEILILQQYQQVVHQIRRFIGQLNTIVNGGRQRGFYTFFANLLCNTFGTAGVQFRRIRAGRIGGFALCQQLLQLIQE
uniref:Phosphoribosyl-AMP cyclohydrolase n=1 Tax=Salmonella enterica subsp. salamae serovar Greenside TaxID=297361 RepID=Q5UHA3_SALER|nr:phosphoribosyl-AMP cyclohydrolase [Salmonella enterica subsp. salamae serovar Greenside]